MKSYAVHYKNKYPGGRVDFSDDRLDAYDSEGGHRVALRLNGAGQWVCRSEEFGCIDRHDLSPIPKDSRAHKLHKDGKIGPSEEHAERVVAAKKFMKNGKVLSEVEYVKEAKEVKK